MHLCWNNGISLLVLWISDRTQCSDNICPPEPESCLNTSNCTCMDGLKKMYVGNTFTCEDIQECRDGSHRCGQLTKCRNLRGGYFCECASGTRRGNETQFCPTGNKAENVCTDIDECRESSSICGPNSDCTNTFGSYVCTCRSGYRNISNTCYEMPKCKSNFTNPEELVLCAMLNTSDAVCSVLQNTFNLLEVSCQTYKNFRTKEEAVKEFTKVVDNLTQIIVKSPLPSALTRDQRGIFGTTFLSNVETIVLLSFTDFPRSQNISTSGIDLSMKASRDYCSRGVQSIILNLSDNIMEVPCSLVSGDRDGAIFITYKGLESTLNGNILTTQDPEDNRKSVIISRVVTGAIANPARVNFHSPVIFRLSHVETLKPFHKSICVFWSSDLYGWSNTDCITTSYNNDYTTCSCFHFSSFAVIMAPHDTAVIKKHHGLTIVSHIGLSISLLFLCLSLLTFIICRSLRTAHTSVLTALCGCLFLGQLLVTVGLNQTSNKVLCSVIAGGIQFLFLCAFCWMFIESILLFMTVRNLQALNYMTSQGSNFPKMCLVGFGIPAVIVGISAAVHPHEYGTETYCWLSTDLVWSFLGPVCVFIIVNTTLLVLTVLLLRTKLASLNPNVSTAKNTWSRARFGSQLRSQSSEEPNPFISTFFGY
ncbi:adhesion G protein-coupled receptor E1-like isoform X2 [Pseudophryne corroboree]|uniref:adhesion G protein-coupled receptor E1-like isoform X2 n=1 Tax=Pseudophryne corroboree TaxID=495146 RepID=UPI0030815A4D